MLRYLFITGSILLFTVSCNKKMQVQYPENGSYGQNILRMQPGDSLLSGTNYSMCAEIGKEAQFSIKVTNLTPAKGGWKFDFPGNWVINDYNQQKNSQSITCTNVGNNDIQFSSENTTGSIKVDFYENSTLPSFSKTFHWKE